MPAVPPFYEMRTVYGPFRRRQSPTQDAETLVKQLLSGEVWGKRPSYGMIPAVQAFNGPLRPGISGIEFWSFEPPDRPHGPLAQWSMAGPYVTIDSEKEVAKLSVAFIRITQDLVRLVK